MSLFRAIPINAHAALEVAAAPLLIVAPFALGFKPPGRRTQHHASASC
jgi:hypothetical protein